MYKSYVLGLLLSIAMVTGPGFAQDNRLIKIMDVRDLISMPTGDNKCDFSPIFGQLGEEEDCSFLPIEEGTCTPIGESELESLLEQTLGGAGEFKLNQGRLTIAGPAEGVNRCVALVKKLKESIGKPVTISLTWLDPGPDAFGMEGGVLTAERTENLLASLRQDGPMQELVTGDLQVLPGSAGYWRSINRVSHLARYECDVASKAMIAYPKMSNSRTGYQVRVRVAPLPGGKVALFVDAWRGSKLDLRKVTIGLPHTPWVELGAADLTLLSGSGAVGRGEALLFCDWSRESGGSYLLVKVLETPTELPGTAFIGPLFLSWHTDLRGPRAPLPGGGYFSSRNNWKDRSDEVFPLAMDPGDAAEYAQSIGLDFKSFLPAGGVLVGPAWRGEQWQKFTAGVVGAEGLTSRVDVQWKGLPLDAAIGMSKQEVFSRGRSVRRVSFPVLIGREGIFLSGRESQYLAGYAAEVAEEAAIPLPLVATCWRGVSGRISMPGGQGCLTLEQHQVGPPEIIHASAKDGGPVERIKHCLSELTGRAKMGSTRLLGEIGGTTGEEEPFRMFVGINLK